MSKFRLGTAILGCIFLLGALIAGWFIFFHQQNAAFIWPSTSVTPTPSADDLQLPPGITLSSPDRPSALSQQQALALARQFEPQAAARAQNTVARYVLVSTSSKTYPALHNVPAWLIWYQKIPLASTLENADPTPPAHPSHDLYVFLDASAGKALLSIWV